MKNIIDKFNDEKFKIFQMHEWVQRNPWWCFDDELSDEAIVIHEQLLKENYNDKMPSYWDQIEIRLYKFKKNKYLEYYSHGN